MSASECSTQGARSSKCSLFDNRKNAFVQLQARPGAKGREADLFCLVKKIMANEIRRKNSFLSGKLSSAYLKPEFGDERGLSDSKSERMAEGHSRVKSDLGWSLRGSVAGSSSIPAKPPISNGEQVGFDLKFPVTYGVFPTLGRFGFRISFTVSPH
jgi:hypothetical protein